MSKPVILFVSHKPKQCGVYEFGKSIFEAISASTEYHFIKAECESPEELMKALGVHHPAAIIYNYHPSVLPWICTRISKGIYRNNISGIRAIQIGIVHEITQEVADTATGYKNKYITGPSKKRLNSLFDFYIAPDPTLLLKNPLVFKTGRLIPAYDGRIPVPGQTIIGSFGFATPKKGFEKLVQRVNEEFGDAVIRLNIPSADFGDADGSNARRIAANCRNLVTKPGIRLDVTHEFLADQVLLDFLAGNSMNVFLYEDTQGRGISSAVDIAMSVKRPVAVSRCPMFRHILQARPSVCVDDNSLKAILEKGFSPLEKMAEDWTPENLCWDYERILDSIFYSVGHPVRAKMGVIRTGKSVVNRLFTLPDQSFTWLRNTDAATEDDLTPVQTTTYTPVIIPAGKGLNRILDDEARLLYKPAEEKLFELAPKTMAKKISRANVQQAFVFDTVYRQLNKYNNPKLLCVGSYEDTASMALQKMGFEVEDIDPMINYFLQEYYTKPSTSKNSYDIIFSTSVIEHDPDDESFIRCISGLLKPGGTAVITCDYKEGWMPGDPKPAVDARFYTKADLEKRLLSCIPDCEIVDVPHWDAPNPDFNYLGKYQYTFATFVIRKKSN
ncbi:MAG: methyltransferase domain-containing protein [Chitinophagaceae bacterium]